jgi:hypothetical protein
MMPLAQSVAAPAVHATFSRSRPCILDPRLALSGSGLLAAARLSAECSVWLPRELRETLKSPKAFRGQPDKLAPRVYGAQTRALPRRDDEIRDALGQWGAVLQGPLASLRFYYLGESASDGVLPGAMDHAVHERFERLAAGLDVAMQRASYDLPRGEAVAACFRDATALCAALAPYGSFVLSTLEPDGRGAPALCNYLDAWDLPVSDVSARAGADAEVLRVLLARAGLGPVEWAGARFAAVHVVPPGLGLELGDEDDVAAQWRRTRVFWHLV